MSFQARSIYQTEQPHKLIQGLQNARVISEEPRTTTVGVVQMLWIILSSPFHLFLMMIGLGKKPKEAKPEAVVALPQRGVPHGVTHAKVFAKDIRLQYTSNGPEFYFCDTSNYVAIASTFGGADDGEYPPSNACRLHGLPKRLPLLSGKYDGELEVAINGACIVKVLSLHAKIPEVVNA